MKAHHFLFFIVPLILSCSESISTPKSEKSYAKTHDEARKFCKANKFNEDYYFLIDLSLHSGRNRFFIYDFKNDSVTHSKLVTHGSCDVFENNPTPYNQAKFSNKDNSHCSSIGKYKLGKRDYSSWGIKIKYWMHGLEASNSNAVNRVVVLHSWDAVPDREVYPNYTPLSWGCPAVSDEFMKLLDEKLKKTSKPVLLWIVG